MREWVRRFRGYLIVLPFALVIGYGFHVYQAWTGNDGIAHRPVDVPKGEERDLGAVTVKLVSVTVKQPQQSSSGIGGDAPEDAVIVVAKFQGKIRQAKNNKAIEKIYCDAKVENGDGWKWDSEYLREPYIPKDAATTCNGKRLGSDFKDIFPKVGEWFDFYNTYYVPEDRAKDLRPTLGRYQDYPEYARFLS